MRKQVVTGDPGLPVGFLVVAAELLLEHAVDVAKLLLLAQLDLVLRLADAPPAVITGRVRAPVEVLRLVLIEQLACATADLGAGSCIASHLVTPSASWAGSRCAESG